MTQLHVDPVYRPYLTRTVSRIPDHMSIISRVDHVLTKETSGNRFSALIWPISTYCMLISQRITFTPTVSLFLRARFAALQINGLERNRSVCRHAQTARRCRTRRIHSSIHTAAPTRRVPFASTENTTRCGLSVPGEPDAVDAVYTGNPMRTVRERYARRVKFV